MRCPDCLGTAFTPGAFEVAEVINHQPVLFRNVPGERCKQCGYLVIDAKVGRRIEALLRDSVSAMTVPAAVFDLAVSDVDMR